jgi:hypothetical protein
MDENETEIAAVATTAFLSVFLARSRRKKRWERSVWIKPSIASRESDGAFHKLMKDLEKDVDSLKNYLRMDLPAFEELLGKIGTYLQKKDTLFRNSISPAEQLAVTLWQQANRTQVCNTNSASIKVLCQSLFLQVVTPLPHIVRSILNAQALPKSGKKLQLSFTSVGNYRNVLVQLMASMYELSILGVLALIITTTRASTALC